MPDKTGKHTGIKWLCRIVGHRSYIPGEVCAERQKILQAPECARCKVRPLRFDEFLQIAAFKRLDNEIITDDELERLGKLYENSEHGMMYAGIM